MLFVARLYGEQYNLTRYGHLLFNTFCWAKRGKMANAGDLLDFLYV